MPEPVSKPMQLNSRDYKKIAKDAVVFFIAPILFYLLQIQGQILQPNHVASFNDFIPNATTIVAIEAWVVNTAINLVKKFIA
jgi:hypothetical protein